MNISIPPKLRMECKGILDMEGVCPDSCTSTSLWMHTDSDFEAKEKEV